MGLNRMVGCNGVAICMFDRASALVGDSEWMLLYLYIHYLFFFWVVVAHSRPRLSSSHPTTLSLLSPNNQNSVCLTVRRGVIVR